MTADRVWTRGDMADAHEAYLAAYGTNGGQGLALALAAIGLGGEPLRAAVAAYWARADWLGAARVRKGSKLSIVEADSMLDAIARAGGKVSKGEGGAWTVEVLVAAMIATGLPRVSAPFDALFGAEGPLRARVSAAFCHAGDGGGLALQHDIGTVSRDELQAVCEVLNAERVPLPSGPRSTAPYPDADPDHARHVAMILAARKCGAPKVDPYDAFAVNALNTAGRGELGSVGETTRAGAEAHARLRLATARSCAANLARDIAELERALAEHGREGKDGAP